MEYYFFLGCECIQFSAESFKIAVYDRGPSFGGTLENGVLGEMGYAFMVAGFISCAALDAQCAIRNG
jgi:hypothetical protein